MEIYYFNQKLITRWINKRVIDFFRLLLMSGAALPLFSAGYIQANPPTLKFLFQLNDKEGFVPSNQLVIWLQRPGSEYVKTFFVSDYLACGSYIEDICPTWMRKLEGEDLSDDMIDAVSQATPDVGDVILEFDFPVDELDTGTYEYCIEIHVTREYNELYCGEIEITGKGNNPVIGDVHVDYLPEKCPKGNGLLSNINVTVVNE
jgi:hypothetical protein